jgi:hypothetical protein
MRLLIVLALFMLPMAVAQFYSTDSYALTSESVQQETLLDKTVLSKRQASNKSVYEDKKLYSPKTTVTPVKNKQAKTSINQPSKTKKVRLMKGKKTTQGANLLSFLLLLKGKSK